MNARETIRLFDVIQGMSQFEEVAENFESKHASKAGAASGGLKKALKYVGGATAVGGGMAGAHAYGKSSGEKSGNEAGRKSQRREDVNQFRGQAKNIYNAGRVSQRRKDVSQFRNFLSRSKGGPSKSQSVKKASEMTEAELANEIVDGWARGEIKTASVATLGRDDMVKIANVLMQRKGNGDKVAEMLWVALNSI